MNLVFKTFNANHYVEYKSWYSHSSIKDHLYDIDQEWLDHIINQKDGINYAIFNNNVMIAQMGISYPTQRHPSYVINSLAISPHYQRQGFGQAIINQLLEMHPLTENQTWVAYVEKKNHTAQKFFETLGWEKKEDEDMWAYVLEFKI